MLPQRQREVFVGLDPPRIDIEMDDLRRVSALIGTGQKPLSVGIRPYANTEGIVAPQCCRAVPRSVALAPGLRAEAAVRR
jgi:hypothetical protein